MGKILVIKFTAELAILRQRFSERTNGIVPPPLEKMLIAQVKKWGPVGCDHEIDTSEMTEYDVCQAIEPIVKKYMGVQT